MNFTPKSIRWNRCALLATGVMGLSVFSPLGAADAPATPAAVPAAAPAAAPPGSWFVFSPPKEDEVLAAASRVKMLTVAKTFLERDQPELLAGLLAVENPFYAKQPPAPEPVSATNANASSAAQPAGPPKLSEEEKLKAVGDKLQPTGIIEAGGRRLVVISRAVGDPLEVGKSFSVIVPPDTVPISVQLVDANDTSCALKMNGTTVTVNYVSKASSPSRAPSSTTSSQPKP